MNMFSDSILSKCRMHERACSCKVWFIYDSGDLIIFMFTSLLLLLDAHHYSTSWASRASLGLPRDQSERSVLASPNPELSLDMTFGWCVRWHGRVYIAQVLISSYITWIKHKTTFIINWFSHVSFIRGCVCKCQARFVMNNRAIGMNRKKSHIFTGLSLILHIQCCELFYLIYLYVLHIYFKIVSYAKGACVKTA